jgi:hypothetical protein
VLKKFIRCLTKNENNREVLNVNSIAFERTAFHFMRDQQEWVLMLGGLIANKGYNQKVCPHQHPAVLAFNFCSTASGFVRITFFFFFFAVRLL